MTKLYIYEHGACRYDEFTNKSIMDLSKVLTLVAEGLAAKKKGEDEYEEFLEDRIEDTDDLTYDEGKAIYSLVNGSDCDKDSTRKINARINKLVKGESFYIYLEESTIGFASSKKEAREVCLCAGGEGW